MTLDLTADEKLALIRFLTRTIDDDPYPLSPRLLPLKAILAKLEPPKPQPEPLPALRASAAPSRPVVPGRGRRR